MQPHILLTLFLATVTTASTHIPAAAPHSPPSLSATLLSYINPYNYAHNQAQAQAASTTEYNDSHATAAVAAAAAAADPPFVKPLTAALAPAQQPLVVNAEEGAAATRKYNHVPPTLYAGAAPGPLEPLGGLSGPWRRWRACAAVGVGALGWAWLIGV